MNTQAVQSSTPSPPFEFEPALRVAGRTVSLKQVLARGQFEGYADIFRRTAESAWIRIEAERLGVTIPGEEVQREADAFRRANGLLKAAALYTWLRERRIGPDEWGEFIEDRLLRRRLAETLFPDDSLLPEFLRSKAEFDKAELSHCVVASDRTAREIYQQVREGRRDFHFFARKYSLDSETSRRGGYLGWVNRNSVANAELETAVFGARPGDVLPPVLDGRQWRIVYVEALKPADFEEAKPVLRQRLFEARTASELDRAGVRIQLFDACRMYSESEG